LGIVSPVGAGVETFRKALTARTSGVDSITRFDTTGLGCHRAALVREFKPRQILPSLDVRRMDPLNQYATVAAGLAFRDARLESRRIPEERIGVVVGLTRGPVSAQENFLGSLRRDGLEKLSAKYFPSMVVSTVGGQVSQALRLKALNSTLVDGASAGLHSIIHGFEMLRQNDVQDALIVVSTDEIGPMFFRLFDNCGMLAGNLHVYDPDSRGTVLGEGGVALVLERASSAALRGARVYGEISGCGLTSDSERSGMQPSGMWLSRAMELALAEAKLDASELCFCYGQGRGIPDYDQRELRAWDRLFNGDAPPVGCVTGNVGFAEASSGGFGVAAALLGLHYGEVYPLAGTNAPAPLVHDRMLTGTYHCAMVAGGSENGNNAALVLERR
jgi:3-oxoacyl-[acyl-carrier-protein] synthase II